MSKQSTMSKQRDLEKTIMLDATEHPSRWTCRLYAFAHGHSFYTVQNAVRILRGAGLLERGTHKLKPTPEGRAAYQRHSSSSTTLHRSPIPSGS
jgi:hypothetical protein